MTTKILAWSDYCSPTGFSNVMSNILKRLPKDEFEIDVLGIGFFGDPDYDHDNFPGQVYPARSSIQPPYNDQYGRQKLLDLLRRGTYDVLFMLQDTFIAETVVPKIIELRKRFNLNFKIVYYFPIDSPPWVRWIRDSVSLVDCPIAYTNYGYQSAVASDSELEHRLKIIPHGIDLNYFKPLSSDKIQTYRKYWHPAANGKLFLLNVNRNQPRKDLPRSLQVLAEIKKSRTDVYLYLHASLKDVGGDLLPIANQLGLQRDIDFFIPKDIDEYPYGYPVHHLNLIYNISDAVITTSLGEGWGLSMTEAMATKTLVIAPGHTALREIVGGRGIITKCGANSSDSNSLWTTIAGDNPVLRPQTDVVDMAEKICELNTTESFKRKQFVERAYDWVKTLNWDIIVKEEWEPILNAE